VLEQIQAGRVLLRLVQGLHLRGYQRLRIAPGMAPSGLHWRCAITAVTNIRRSHGAEIASRKIPTEHYSSSSGRTYFGWDDSAHADPDRLAERFIARFPELVAEARGRDWAYVGWYTEMMNLTYPASLPIAYADYELPAALMTAVGDGASELTIPLPPPGEAD
jgi:hypothetical protein